MGPKKRKKHEKISDDMIGGADRICACAARVGDIITAQNESRPEKTSLKKIKDELERQTGGKDDAQKDERQES